MQWQSPFHLQLNKTPLQIQQKDSSVFYDNDDDDDHDNDNDNDNNNVNDYDNYAYDDNDINCHKC